MVKKTGKYYILENLLILLIIRNPHQRANHQITTALIIKTSSNLCLNTLADILLKYPRLRKIDLSKIISPVVRKENFRAFKNQKSW